MARNRFVRNPSSFEKLDQFLNLNPQLLYHYPISLGGSDFEYNRNNMNITYDNPSALYNPNTFYRWQHDHPMNVPVNNNNINFMDYGYQSNGNTHR